MKRAFVENIWRPLSFQAELGSAVLTAELVHVSDPVISYLNEV